MALNTYDGLKASIASWWHNTALADQIPDFITLAEARIKAVLRSRGQGEAVTLAVAKGAKTVALPADLLHIRSASIPGVAPTLGYITPAEHAIRYSVGAGAPRNYTIVDGLLYLGPVPDAAYSISLVYDAAYPALSPSNQTNALLTKWPNLYLWAALCEAATFAEDTERLAKYEAKFGAALNGINDIEAGASGGLVIKSDTRNF